MLKKGSVEAQQHITSLMQNLAMDPEMRGPIAAAGGVEQLVRQLAEGSDTTQAEAARALRRLL